MSIPEDLVAVYSPIIDTIELTNTIIREEGLSGVALAIPGFVASGKRLRSAALLFSAKAFGSQQYKPAKLAAGIELIHASSLVHDDVVDNSRFRRNNLSLPFEFGPRLAVLAGDYLFTKGITFIDQAGGPEHVRETIWAVSKMIEGEIEEELAPPEKQLEEHVYLSIINRKTAVLFRTAMKIGAMYRELDPQTIDLFADIGESFGMAYQIIDDCQDLFSPSDPDIEQQKITLPIIKAFQKGKIRRHLDIKNAKALRNAIKKANGFEESVDLALEFLKQGRSLISKLNDQEISLYLNNYFSYLEKQGEKFLELVV